MMLTCPLSLEGDSMGSYLFQLEAGNNPYITTLFFNPALAAAPVP